MLELQLLLVLLLLEVDRSLTFVVDAVLAGGVGTAIAGEVAIAS